MRANLQLSKYQYCDIQTQWRNHCYQILCKRVAYVTVYVVQTDVSLPVMSVEVVSGGKGS